LLPKQRRYVLGLNMSHLSPVFNFGSSVPATMVSGPGNVVKIRLKHFSAVLT